MSVAERLEQAIAKASARGISLDVGRPIPEYQDYDYQAHTGAPPRRDRVYEDGKLKHPGIPGVLSGEGRQTRSRVGRGFTHEQLAFAASTLDPLQLAAVLWCLNLDQPSRVLLKYELLQFALELRERERWPLELRRADCALTGFTRSPRYVQDLCTIALTEGAEPHTLGTEAARAKYFGLSEKHWRRSGIARGYNAISARLKYWFDEGIDDLRRRLVARAA